MRPPVHLRFVDKAAAAMTSAVEVYNKPSFAYREETFSILGLNAWELLLKAKVLKDAANDLRCLRVYEPRRTKSGKLSKKLYLTRNRAGNPQSISIGASIAAIDKSTAKLPLEIKGNLAALTEIRDNSVHYVTASPVSVSGWPCHLESDKKAGKHSVHETNKWTLWKRREWRGANTAPNSGPRCFRPAAMPTHPLPR